MKSHIQFPTEPTNAPVRATFAHTCLSTCRRLLAQIQRVKAGIFAEFCGRLEEHNHLLELAVNEAEALAWQTDFPQLLFPALAMEKAQSVAQWHARQRFVRQQSTPRAMAA